MSNSHQINCTHFQSLVWYILIVTSSVRAATPNKREDPFPVSPVTPSPALHVVATALAPTTIDLRCFWTLDPRASTEIILLSSFSSCPTQCFWDPLTFLYISGSSLRRVSCCLSLDHSSIFIHAPMDEHWVVPKLGSLWKERTLRNTFPLCDMHFYFSWIPGSGIAGAKDR